MSVKIVALYVRISKEDLGKMSDDAYSQSISNQRILLNNYVSVRFPDKVEVREFIDDGFSGTNFERPAFQEMLNLVEQGKVETIIVKDTSRLGRNYLRVGEFLENVFPSYGVRFISVNENYDSGVNGKRVPGLDMEFKSIIHGYYSKELSRKSRGAKLNQVKKGKGIMARPPYGYWKSETEKGKLEIDSESAKVVRDIFNLYIEGMSAYAIAKLLNEWQIDSPNTRLEKNGMVKFKAPNKPILWSTHAVLSILSNQVMAGDMVGHKCTRIEVGRNVCKDLDKSEWIIVSNTHEAIIEPEIFAEVQKRLNECSTKR